MGTRDLSFVTTVTGEAIPVVVTGVHEYEWSYHSDLPNDMFPDAGISASDCYVVQGLLWRADKDDIATATISTLGENYRRDPDSATQTVSEDDLYLGFIAVVGFTKEGAFAGALVQRVPSPVDQFLPIPL